MKAILTGHTYGIGHALAADLLARGIPVLALARGESAQLGLAFPDLFEQHRVDLSDPEALRGWLAEDSVARYLADADTVLLLNNAGTLGPVGPLGRQDAAAIIRAVNLNVTAPLLLSEEVVRRHPGALRILHISSGAGRAPIAGWSIYCATKAALDQHARTVQADGAPHIRIASIAPGVVDTEMQAAIRRIDVADFPALERFIALKTEGQLSSPEQVAQGLVDYVLGECFGTEPVIDLRNL